MNKSYLILIYEFAAQNINLGFTEEELINYLAKNGIDTDDKLMKEKINFLYMTDIITRDQDGKRLHFMAAEAYYRYLGYLEMKAAQENAKNASRLAIVAVGISSILALIQIIVAVQINYA